MNEVSFNKMRIFHQMSYKDIVEFNRLLFLFLYESVLTVLENKELIKLRKSALERYLHKVYIIPRNSTDIARIRKQIRNISMSFPKWIRHDGTFVYVHVNHVPEILRDKFNIIMERIANKQYNFEKEEIEEIMQKEEKESNKKFLED